MKGSRYILNFFIIASANGLSSPAMRPSLGGSVHSPEKQSTASSSPKRIHSYDEAFAIIDECAINKSSNEDLFDAVRYVERNAYKLYPDLAAKQALWQRAHGSFELVLSTGSAKSHDFHAPPSFLPFSYAMIDDEYFGNGVGLNKDVIWISMLHRHHFDPQIRRMVVTLRDIYIRGHKVTRRIPSFIRKGLNLGKNPEDFVEKPPPTFVIVGASEKALVARGNQSGGLAIWSRMSDDIRNVAYKNKA